jgi:hypothetical protein
MVNFALQVLFERFFIPTKAYGVMLEIYSETHAGLHVKRPLIVLDFNENGNLSTKSSSAP